MKEESEKWINNELWSKIDKEAANFAFEQGEKYLFELQEVAKSIVNRAYLVLGVAVTVCPLLITTSITVSNEILRFVIYVFMVFCVGISIYVTGIIKPDRGCCLGRDPKSLLYSCPWEHRKATKSNIKMYELENLQKKIEALKGDNEYKARQLATALYSAVIALSVCLIATLFV